MPTAKLVWALGLMAIGALCEIAKHLIMSWPWK